MIWKSLNHMDFEVVFDLNISLAISFGSFFFVCVLLRQDHVTQWHHKNGWNISFVRSFVGSFVGSIKSWEFTNLLHYYQFLMHTFIFVYSLHSTYSQNVIHMDTSTRRQCGTNKCINKYYILCLYIFRSTHNTLDDIRT